jgi:hypothetical protein
MPKEMTERQRQAKIRKAHGLPYRCECGGIMEYAADFGRVFSVCKSCTPVVRIRLKPQSLNQPRA